MLYRYVMVICLVSSPLVVHSADSDGNYAIWGIGQSSCHQFNKAKHAGQLTKHADYLMGYLTAFNTLSENTYDIGGGAKLDDALDWIGSYCDLHQIESLNRAIQQYVDDRFEKRLKNPPGRQKGWGTNGGE